MMKKIVLAALCLMMLGLQQTEAQVSIAVLHHEGNVTVFNSAKIQDAVDQAVQGDTIYLSEGIFSGFQMRKGIAVIGSGQQTVVSSQILIGDTNPVEGVLISSMHVMGDIMVNYTATGLSIRHCRFQTFGASAYPLDDADISMSQLNVLSISSSVQSLTVHTSKVTATEGSTDLGNLYFMNCNIDHLNDAFAICQNCIINTYNYGANTHVNCLLYGTEAADANTQNSYWNAEWSFDEDLNCSLDEQQLRNNNYMGTDGTPVGCTGSTAPFTLVPSTPRVTSHTLSVDNKERKLNVTLTIGAN